MADIALLVAEDFEKSSKGWEKGDHGIRRDECFHFLASFTVSALGRKAREKAAASLKEATAAKEVVERALGPRSPLGLAAFDGFFSA